MAAEQTYYKDLKGDRKAKLKEFIFNPKSADPTGSDRIPDELYINDTDKQLKYYDDNLDLRYAVPGVVQAIAPTPLDLDYEIGQEWHLDNHSATYKLLDKATVNGVLEAVWIIEEDLIPRKKANGHLNFYVDFDFGNDTNTGDAANPFATIQGALNSVLETYDFQNVYTYTLNVVSISQSVGAIYVRKPYGYSGQTMTIKGVNPETELDSLGGNMFILRSDMEIRIENFRFIGGGTTSFINGSAGRANLISNVFTGLCKFSILATENFRVTVGSNNKINNLQGINLFRLGQFADLHQTGMIEASGSSIFTQTLYTANNSYLTINATAGITLTSGATVTGRRFASYHSSSLLFSQFDQLNEYGDARGTSLSEGTYRGKGTYYNYSHWIEGLAIAQAGNDITIAPGEYKIKVAQQTKATEYFGVNVIQTALTIPFADTRLDTINEVWVYARDQEVIEFLAVPPDPSNLLIRVCLGKLTTADNATIATLDAQISERSPEFMDSLNAPGSIDNCVIANSAMNNLNNTLVGEKWVFDPLTFSTSSSTTYSASADGITVLEGGTYKIDAILNCSVGNTGPQRPSVGIRVAINGIERLVAGRSAYIRRASGHYRGSTTTSARVTLNPGDQITMLGFRDAQSGVVSAPAGQSELTMLKMT